MTVRINKYDDYREALLAGGAPADQVEVVIADMKAEDVKIDAGVCPNCDSTLTRAKDPRQLRGPTSVAGKWFNYRCVNRCGWLLDRCEPIGEN